MGIFIEILSQKIFWFHKMVNLKFQISDLLKKLMRTRKYMKLWELNFIWHLSCFRARTIIQNAIFGVLA